MLPPDFTLLQVTPALDAGGVERTTVDVAAAVVRAGGRALVASAGGRLEGELREAGGRLIELPVDSKNPLQMLLNVRRLEAVIRQEAVTLVHARSRASAWSALAAARRTRTPFVTTYAGAHSARSSLKRAYNSIMARGEVVIANSAWTRDHLLAEHDTAPEKVRVIPRGVDLARFDPLKVDVRRLREARARLDLGPFEHRPVFLLAGRLTRWKGQALLIEALARSGVDAQLVLAGDDQGRTGYRDELAVAAERLGVADRVRIVGHLDDMPAAYAACDFACAPSLQPEAFGRTAVEPQAMKRPVLAAAHGAPAETVVDGETGVLVTPGDVDAWAAALRAAVETPPALRAHMGEAGRENAARYSLQAMTDATLEIYAELAPAPPA